jgi:hypothetical protein
MARAGFVAVDDSVTNRICYCLILEEEKSLNFVSVLSDEVNSYTQLESVDSNLFFINRLVIPFLSRTTEVNQSFSYLSAQVQQFTSRCKSDFYRTFCIQILFPITLGNSCVSVSPLLPNIGEEFFPVICSISHNDRPADDINPNPGVFPGFLLNRHAIQSDECLTNYRHDNYFVVCYFL